MNIQDGQNLGPFLGHRGVSRDVAGLLLRECSGNTLLALSSVSKRERAYVLNFVKRNTQALQNRFFESARKCTEQGYKEAFSILILLERAFADNEEQMATQMTLFIDRLARASSFPKASKESIPSGVFGLTYSDHHRGNKALISKVKERAAAFLNVLERVLMSPAFSEKSKLSLLGYVQVLQDLGDYRVSPHEDPSVSKPFYSENKQALKLLVDMDLSLSSEASEKARQIIRSIMKGYAINDPCDSMNSYISEIYRSKHAHSPLDDTRTLKPFVITLLCALFALFIARKFM